MKRDRKQALSRELARRADELRLEGKRLIARTMALVAAMEASAKRLEAKAAGHEEAGRQCV